MSAVCGRGLYSQQPVEKRRGGVQGRTHCPVSGPLPYPPPPPAPLLGDEWWYLLKVKPAGEPWLGAGRRG